MKTVLVVEENPELRRMLLEHLPSVFSHWLMVGAVDSREAQVAYETQRIALAIIEPALGRDRFAGFRLVRRWRADGATFPIAYSSADPAALPRLRSSAPDLILQKPWRPIEALRGLRVVTTAGRYHTEGARRAAKLGEWQQRSFCFAGAEITRDGCCRFPNGTVELLSAREYLLLQSFSRRRGESFTMESLRREFWKEIPRADCRTVEIRLARLRQLFVANGARWDRAVFKGDYNTWRLSEKA